MKIYKVYDSGRDEARANDTALFEEITMEQNNTEGEFFTNRALANAAYNAIDVGTASKAGYRCWFFWGKLIEEATIDDDQYAEAIADGKSLRDIFLDSGNWEILAMEVSSEYVDPIPDHDEDEEED